MNTLNCRLAVALGVAALFGAAAVQAQELHQAKVTFGFEVAGQKMEAGTYRAILDTLGSLTIENTTTNHQVYLMPLPRSVADNERSSLTFRCYAGQCFLNKVQFGQTDYVYGVPQTKHEKEVAAKEDGKTVYVAMR
jgi:hypothetical protein